MTEDENSVKPEKKYSPPYTPTQDEFLTEFNKFPRGEPEGTYQVVKYAVLTYKTFNGKAVTWQLLKEKWNQYLDINRAEMQNEKYMVGMKNFIEKKKYNENFMPSVKNWMKNLTKP